MDIKATITVQLHPDTLNVLQGLLGKLNGHTTVAPSANGKVKKESVKTEPVNGTDTAELVKVTIEQVRAAAQQKASSGKKDQVKALLSEFSADKITNLQEKDYAGFLEKVNEL